MSDVGDIEELDEPPMSDRDTFWRIIDATTEFGDDQDEQLEELADLIGEMNHDGLLSFEQDMQMAVVKAYTEGLSHAADMICGGCSDDHFEYFRGWIISHGKEVYQAAIEDPDSLLRILPKTGPVEASFEAILYVASDVYEKRYGKSMPEWDYPERDPEVEVIWPGKAAVAELCPGILSWAESWGPVYD